MDAEVGVVITVKCSVGMVLEVGEKDGDGVGISDNVGETVNVRVSTGVVVGEGL